MCELVPILNNLDDSAAPEMTLRWTVAARMAGKKTKERAKKSHTKEQIGEGQQLRVRKVWGRR